MAGDDLFKRYLEIGASALGMSRERAESIVKDLVASGEVARGQAVKAADWLVERGRAGTEELAELVRREVRQQVEALGLATKEDIARLEARLPGAPEAAAKKVPAAAKVATSKPAVKRRTVPVPADDNGAAGIARSASVGRRTPPAGGAVAPKG